MHRRGDIVPVPENCHPYYRIAIMLGITIAIIAVAISISALGLQVFTLRRVIEEWSQRKAA
jgi:hypothetical protein